MKRASFKLRTSLRWWLLPILVLLISGCDTATTPIDRIILVTIDTLRADHLPFYGYPRPTAPFLSSLAEKGTVFDQCLTTSSHTAPSHASVFTSLYPHQHGLLRNGETIYDEIETMAGLLREGGYRTGAFSSIGFLEPLASDFETNDVRNGPDGNPRSAEEVVDAAIEWLSEQAPEEKIFLWIHLYDVHEWEGPLTDITAHSKAVQRESSLSWKELGGFLQEEHGLDETALARIHWTPRRLVRSYDGTIRYVDSELRRLYEAVKPESPDGRALWIVTADHGEGLLSHAYLGHGRKLYREQLHVPLILYDSADDESIPRVDGVVRTVDILPTVMQMTRLTPAHAGERWEGRSLYRLLHGRSNEPDHRPAFAMRRPADQGRHWKGGEFYVMQEGPFKYILATNGGDQFYDLASDPLELDNLIDTSHLEIDRIKRMLFAVKQKKPHVRPVKSDEPNPEDYLEELKALGYVQ